MPRTIRYSSRDVFSLCAATALVLIVLLVAACMMKADCDSVKQESVTVVPSDRVGPGVEKAIQSMSESWREENRNR